MFDLASFARVLAFAVVYAGIEYRYLNRYEKAFPSERPVFGLIMPYHLFFLLPLFIITSYTPAVTAWAGNVLSLAVAEDVVYFAWRGKAVTRQDWTANLVGSFDAGGTAVPFWWIVCGLAAAALFLVSF